MDDALARVLEFWFGAPGSPEAAGKRDFWFKGTPDLDRDIRDRFLADHERAASGGFDGVETSDEHLAVLILLDQFPRNMFRGTPRAFATDPLARTWTKRVISRRLDALQPPHRRLFFYLPFEHSEDMADQEESIRHFIAMNVAEYTKSAEKHLDVIATYGRFPHRNAALGRVSTPDEEEYLRRPGAGF